MVKKSIHELCPDADSLLLPLPLKKNDFRVHIAALGDVGATLLTGLKLMGGDLISTIGIYDLDPKVVERYEAEMNQTGFPFTGQETGEDIFPSLPVVKPVSEENLFSCDMLVFCASKAVPPVTKSTDVDVRMVQFEANRKIISHYGAMAKAADFKGIFAVVSDPVDPLCKEVLLTSGLEPGQIRGYGLGVMNKRAEYFAIKNPEFSSYLTEGRAFGPHGNDLVIANSIENYNHELSLRLTDMTVKANLDIRQLGFKPYIAPALSSGALSLILTLKGFWNYSSVYMGHGTEGAFLGIKNRIEKDKIIIEDVPLSIPLYDRIEKAYKNLCNII